MPSFRYELNALNLATKQLIEAYWVPKRAGFLWILKLKNSNHEENANFQFFRQNRRASPLLHFNLTTKSGINFQTDGKIEFQNIAPGHLISDQPLQVKSSAVAYPELQHTESLLVS